MRTPKDMRTPFVKDNDLGDLLDRHEEAFDRFGKTVTKGVKIGIVAWLVGAIFSIGLTLGIIGFLVFVIVKVMIHYGIM